MNDDGAATADGGTIGRRRQHAQEGGGANYTERRELIIGAAARLFQAKGYNGTSLGDIAGEVGIDRATLYYYVSSKEELFDEVVTDVVVGNLVVAERIRDSDDPVPDKVRKLITDLLQSYVRHYPFLFVYLQENLAHVGEERRAWSRRMRKVNRQYEAAIEAIVAEGIADGSLRPVADPRIITYGLMGMVNWTNRWFGPQTSSVDAATIGQAYADILLVGLINPASARTDELPPSPPG